MIFKKTPNIIEELKKASSEKRMNTIKGWLDPVASDFRLPCLESWYNGNCACEGKSHRAYPVIGRGRE